MSTESELIEVPEQAGSDLDRKSIVAALMNAQAGGGTISLSGLNIVGVDLSGLDLTRADLRGASFKDCRFRDAVLPGDGQYGTLQAIAGASFRDCDLRGVRANQSTGEFNVNGKEIVKPSEWVGAKDFAGRAIDSKFTGCKFPMTKQERFDAEVQARREEREKREAADSKRQADRQAVYDGQMSLDDFDAKYPGEKRMRNV